MSSDCKCPSSIPAIEETLDHVLKYQCSDLAITGTGVINISNQVDLNASELE